METFRHPLSGLVLRTQVVWRLFASAVAVVMWSGVVTWTAKLWSEPHTGGWVVLLGIWVPVSCLVTWTAGRYWFGRVEFTNDAINVIGVIGARRVLWADIAGYRGLEDKKAKVVRLVDGENKVLVKLNPSLDGIELVDSWVKGNLDDVQEMLAQRELDNARREAVRSGHDPERRLQQARLWTWVLNALAVIAFIPAGWLHFNDGSQQFVLLAAVPMVLLPFVALAQVALWPELVRLIHWQGSKLPSPSLALFTPLGLAVVLSRDTILDVDQQFMWMGTILVLQLVLGFLADPGVQRNPKSLLVLAGFGFLTAFGYVLGANCLLDESEPKLEPVTVLQSRSALGFEEDVRRRKKTEVSRSDGSKLSIELDKPTRETLVVGQVLKLKVREGWLGITWVKHDAAFAR